MESACDSAPYFKILPLVQPGEDDKVPIEKIRKITEKGLNGTQNEDRAMAWLVLLGIFPEYAHEWRDKKQEIYTTYESYVESLGMSDWHTKSIPHQCRKDFFQVGDVDLIDIVHKDVVRTAKHIFMLPPDPLEGEVDDGESPLLIYTVHLRRIERILYVIGSVNKTISYMQGFNELLMPFYTVMFSARVLFDNDPFEVEAMAFTCLNQLLAQTYVIELFMTMNKSEILIARLSLFNDVLDKHLPAVSNRLKELQITPIHYAFKWFSMLFCQNHEMPVIHEIWDALFSHYDRLVDYAFYIGAAEMKIVENDIMNKSFSNTLHVLQNIEVFDIYSVLAIANKWWEDDINPSLISNVKNKLQNIKIPFIKK